MKCVCPVGIVLSAMTKIQSLRVPGPLVHGSKSGV